jgi:hypothetical protein
VIYDVITASDQMCVEASDLKVAQIAIIFLGEGLYGLRDASGKTVLPLFAFGGGEKWVEENIGDVGAFLDAHGEEVAVCLDTLLYCKADVRSIVMGGLGGSLKSIEKFNDEKRTSLNNVAGQAREVAEAIRGRGRRR